MLGQLVLNKYRITRLLDEGGMSKIYLARPIEGGQEVVVKVLKEQFLGHAKTVEHFRREIFISTRFQHPNTPTVFDSASKSIYGPILVMEYLRGIDLHTLLHRERILTPERTGRLLLQLCDVLQAAHTAGIVHRDLKPGNVMLLYSGTPQETVKLMDFGLAKMNSMLYISPEELVDMSLPPASGTPEYISPEMVRGTELDARADLYSLGVMLYEMLVGRRPFLHNTVEGLMIAHLEGKPPSFAAIGQADRVSPALEAVVMRCLAKHPDQRYANAAELFQAYEAALGKRLTAPRSPLNSSGVRPRTAPVPVSPAVSGNGAATNNAMPIPRSVDRHAFRHTVEANMPEVLALTKLKGFVADLGGQILESVPGMIKVRLGETTPAEKKGGLFSWLSGGNDSRSTAMTASPATELELHMERRDPSNSSKLTLTLVMRPAAGGLPTAEWRNRCSGIARDLQAYLMGR